LITTIRLAIENPADGGEFRVFNQMTESMSVLEIAKLVADLHPNAVDVVHLDNPRVEAESHYYKVTHTGLVDLGLRLHPGAFQQHRQGADVVGAEHHVDPRGPAGDLAA